MSRTVKPPNTNHAYTELQVTTNYSFLRGASHIEELIARAAVLRMTALAVTDRNSLAGIVRAHQRAKEAGIRLIVGCRLDLANGPSVLVYPTDRPAYSRLTRLLTVGKGRAGKGKCELHWPDLAAAAEGLIAILCSDPTEANIRRLKADFGDRRLCRPDIDAPAKRRGAAAHHRRHRSGVRRAGGRHQRRAVSRPRPAHPAGCADLHPRGLHHRRTRSSPRAVRGAASSVS